MEWRAKPHRKNPMPEQPRSERKTQNCVIHLFQTRHDPIASARGLLKSLASSNLYPIKNHG